MKKKPMNARRRTQRGETFERGEIYCIDCGELFKPGYERSSACPSCRAKRSNAFTVYDRDAGTGELPLNLRQRYGNVQ